LRRTGERKHAFVETSRAKFFDNEAGKKVAGAGGGAAGAPASVFLNPAESERTKNAEEYLLPKSRKESRGISVTIKLFPTASPTLFLLMGTPLGAVWKHN
jgi:hypothetical protein